MMFQALTTKAPGRRAARRGMLLHCGAKNVSREQVFDTPTPAPTSTWYPLAHRSLIGEVEDQLEAAGFVIEAESHALGHEGMRYFGVFEVNVPGRPAQEHGWVVGIRNSHDKTYPAGLVAGSHVLCCDNLAFTGEVRISRKHTKFAVRDLRHLTARAVGQLGDRFHHLDDRIQAYRGCRLSTTAVHDLVIKAIDCRAITPTQVPHVLQEWRQPSHDEFLPRNAWSLFNAFTEVHKGLNPQMMIARGQALHGLFDRVAGLS
ncbi:DUF932 domain-containing protein [Sulfuriroseicoccus oceanibius]|uniref:DUF932 domain-containing protein n=1 Tax=Sulfuriroseicoccus oceanibius TaxID=2707525 RepID=A0A7T7JB98_9BACT|nr:DUF932 domain-containing protein [Sulfuriroseicoccus oceanibius]QQL43736.1 DUF932 domain-containing protein [Sulfuriroseicoccus oceanibius]